MAMALLDAGFTIPQLFLVTRLMNAAVAIYIYSLVPEFLMRFLAGCWCTRSTGCEHGGRAHPGRGRGACWSATT